MAKNTRLWPYMKTMITVGMAITAAQPTTEAASGWFRVRRTWARGSPLAANSATGMAPIAARATTI